MSKPEVLQVNPRRGLLRLYLKRSGETWRQVEQLNSGMVELARQLCETLGYCRPLPIIPKVWRVSMKQSIYDSSALFDTFPEFRDSC